MTQGRVAFYPKEDNVFIVTKIDNEGNFWNVRAFKFEIDAMLFCSTLAKSDMIRTNEYIVSVLEVE